MGIVIVSSMQTSPGTGEQGLVDDGWACLSRTRRSNWRRFIAEFRMALEAAEGQLLRQWARGSLALAIRVMVQRVGGLLQLVRLVARGAWREFRRFWHALFHGKLSSYFANLCRRTWRVLRDSWHRIKSSLAAAREFAAGLPGADAGRLGDLALQMMVGVLGFVIMGGLGDGGIIDLDWKLLHTHRSFWFHSVFIGLAFEVFVRSALHLVDLLHGYLPRTHSPIWDRLQVLGHRYAQPLLAGSWLGVASHLVVDSHLDGWTPYKDFPIHLPNWGHHLVMDANAAASGWLAWQYHDKVARHFRGSRSRGRVTKKMCSGGLVRG